MSDAIGFKERFDAFARFNPEHVRRRLACLAANLAIGGALCEAFSHGQWFGAVTTTCSGIPASQVWWPGCGRVAPGHNLSPARGRE